MSADMKSDNFLADSRIIGSYPTVTERYFGVKYFRNSQRPDCDQTVLLHSNRLCIITLAPNHHIIRDKKSIKNIDFNIEEKNVNRLDNRVTGKWKKGAQKVGPNSVLCRITCDDDQVYDVKACINGKIVEVNANLVDDYELLTRRTWSDGFIAAIIPFLGRHSNEKESLLSLEEYQQSLESEAKPQPEPLIEDR